MANLRSHDAGVHAGIVYLMARALDLSAEAAVHQQRANSSLVRSAGLGQRIDLANAANGRFGEDALQRGLFTEGPQWADFAQPHPRSRTPPRAVDRGIRHATGQPVNYHSPAWR